MTKLIYLLPLTDYNTCHNKWHRDRTDHSHKQLSPTLDPGFRIRTQIHEPKAEAESETEDNCN